MVIFTVFQMTISSEVYEYPDGKRTFFERAILLIYHIEIFSLARGKRVRKVEMCGMHFDTICHFLHVTPVTSGYYAHILFK